MNPGIQVKNKCVYKAIFSKENVKEEYKNNPYWILSYSGTYSGKLMSRGKYIKKFIKEYSPFNIKIEFIRYVNSQKEFQEIINTYIKDKFCMNNITRQKSAQKNIKKGQLSNEKREQFIENYRKTKEKKRIELLQIPGIFISKKRITTFNEFYLFVQNNILSKKKRPFNLNWKNDKIKQIFLDYFNNTKQTTLKKLENLCRFSSCSPLTKDYWLDRGWDENYANKKIKEQQCDNSLKSANKMTNDRIPSQLNYWINKKGYSLQEAKIKRSEFQNRNSFVSKSSIKLFWPFYEQYKNIYSCYIHQKADPNSHEFGLWDKENNKLYCYDFTIKELKLIFEYQGLHVHPKAEKLKENWNNWRHYFTKETADQIKEKYERKLLIAKNNGFKVIELWEDEKNNNLKIKREIEDSISLQIP